MKIESREKASKRLRTGIPGISFFETDANRRDGTVQQFFSVHYRVNGKRRNDKFCIGTLGRETAWRRALQARAAHEQRVQQQQKQKEN